MHKCSDMQIPMFKYIIQKKKIFVKNKCCFIRMVEMNTKRIF